MSCRRNPITQNCVKETSNAAKTIEACGPLEKCGRRKVINPATGHCVKRSSVVGRISMVCPSLTRLPTPRLPTPRLPTPRLPTPRSPTSPYKAEIAKLQAELRATRRSPTSPYKAEIAKLQSELRKAPAGVSPYKSQIAMLQKEIELLRSGPKVESKAETPPKTPMEEPNRSKYILRRDFKLTERQITPIIQEWNATKESLFATNALRKSRKQEPFPIPTLLEYYIQREEKAKVAAAAQPKIAPKVGPGSPCDAKKKLAGPPDEQFDKYFNLSILIQARRTIRDLPETVKSFISETEITGKDDGTEVDRKNKLREYYEKSLEQIQTTVEKATNALEKFNAPDRTQQLYAKENFYNALMCLIETEKEVRKNREKGTAPPVVKKIAIGNAALANLFANRR